MKYNTLKNHVIVILAKHIGLMVLNLPKAVMFNRLESLSNLNPVAIMTSIINLTKILPTFGRSDVHNDLNYEQKNIPPCF